MRALRSSKAGAARCMGSSLKRAKSIAVVPRAFWCKINMFLPAQRALRLHRRGDNYLWCPHKQLVERTISVWLRVQYYHIHRRAPHNGRIRSMVYVCSSNNSLWKCKKIAAKRSGSVNRMQIFALEQKVSRTENHEALEHVNFHGSDNWTKKSEKSKRERMQSLYI